MTQVLEHVINVAKQIANARSRRKKGVVLIVVKTAAIVTYFNICRRGKFKMSEDKPNSWTCPYCHSGGRTKWNKTAYYELFEHMKKHHLEQAFNDLVSRKTEKGKAAFVDSHWQTYHKFVKYHEQDA